MPGKSEELWFEEKLEIPQGRSMCIRIEKKLASYNSQFQHLDMYKTQSFGNMLCLDGVIQCTEVDEFGYHEMMAHVPLNVHPEPKKALIIGGGDGGIVREVFRHETIEEVHLCELDEEVLNISKKYLPYMSCQLDNPKLKIFYQDGAKFVKEKNNYYDIILVDSTDPIGPGRVLFTPEFYHDMHKALTIDGICVTQSESIFYHEKIIKELASFQNKIFKNAKYYYALVPTYPSGVIGFSFCSKKFHPIKDINRKSAKKLKNLHYYTPQIHIGSFALPKFTENWFEAN